MRWLYLRARSWLTIGALSDFWCRRDSANSWGNGENENMGCRVANIRRLEVWEMRLLSEFDSMNRGHKKHPGIANADVTTGGALPSRSRQPCGELKWGKGFRHDIEANHPCARPASCSRAARRKPRRACSHRNGRCLSN
jgi:hypothetical protein